MEEFPLAKFRILYPSFETVSNEVVLAIAEQALCFVGMYGCACSDQLWMLMVAHLLQLRFDGEDGGVAPGAISSATIDRVSVSFAAPTSSSAWAQWLNLSPFGQQFLALSGRCNSGPRYVGRFAERSAFRNAGGRFPNGGYP